MQIFQQIGILKLIDTLPSMLAYSHTVSTSEIE